MASHATGARRKGDRNPNFTRPWGPTRSGGPTSYAVNGSPHAGRRREHHHPQHQHHRQQQQQQQQRLQQQYHPQQQHTSMSDHDQYKQYLLSGWEKIQRQNGNGEKFTLFAERQALEDLRDFVPVNLDECIAQAYQKAKSEDQTVKQLDTQ